MSDIKRAAGASPRAGQTYRAPEGPTPSVNPVDLASYVAKLAAELVILARAADLKMLAYLMDMVRAEAEQQLTALATKDRGEGGQPERKIQKKHSINLNG